LKRSRFDESPRETIDFVGNQGDAWQIDINVLNTGSGEKCQNTEDDVRECQGIRVKNMQQGLSQASE